MKERNNESMNERIELQINKRMNLKTIKKQKKNILKADTLHVNKHIDWLTFLDMHAVK